MVVSGPQRSGTTFAAKVIAAELGWAFLDETTFGISNVGRWAQAVASEHEAVIQCPSMMKYIHGLPDDVLAVVMRRPVDDIVASQVRIGWEWEPVELARYGLTSGVAAQVKYDWWEQNRHDGPALSVELDYQTLETHPLWVEAPERAGFEAKQTHP